MAITLRDKSLFKKDVVDRQPVQSSAIPVSDNVRLVNETVLAMGRMVEIMANEKPKVDVIATINRGKDGKIASITITNR